VKLAVTIMNHNQKEIM